MKNILLVDDDNELLTGMVDYFRDSGDEYKMYTAGDGKKAVEILESSPMDLVVTDLKMPEMDGIELLAYMNRSFPHTPAIVMSAYGSPEVMARLGQIGSFEFLNKPFILEDLKRTIVDELKHISQEGHVKDISAGSMLQLIEMEEKTCFLEVVGQDGRKGNFYFNKGVLYDASLGDIQGEKAAIEMITWEKVQVHFRSLPGEVIFRKIHSGVMSLVLVSSNSDEEDAEFALSRTPRATGNAGEVETNELPPPEPDEENMGGLAERLKGYGKFDGFLGIGLFDALGSPAALHAGGDIDLMNAGVLVVEVMLRAMNISKKAGSDSARMIYMETDNTHTFISMVDGGGDAASFEMDEMQYYLILIASTNARIGLVKKKFETAAGDIVKAIKNGDVLI